MYGDALEFYDKVLELDSGYFNAWYGRGMVLGELGRYQDALDSYDKALELDSENVDCLWLLPGKYYCNASGLCCGFF